MAHIGILLCDEHYPEAVEKYGTYDVDFKMMLEGGGESNWKYSIWRCHEGQFPESVNSCDAWIISGSKSGAYDLDEWISQLKDFICDLDKAQSKILGVCFGHQVIHSALGGIVEKSEKGWGLGAYSVTLYEKLDHLPAGLNISLLAMHQDQVQSMADEFTLVAGSSFCPFAITRKGDYILTFQAHPEFEDGFYRGLCERVREKAGDDEINRVMPTIGQPDDREDVRKVIRDFLK